jgi:hypothetical protein
MREPCWPKDFWEEKRVKANLNQPQHMHMCASVCVCVCVSVCELCERECEGERTMRSVRHQSITIHTFKHTCRERCSLQFFFRKIQRLHTCSPQRLSPSTTASWRHGNQGCRLCSFEGEMLRQFQLNSRSHKSCVLRVRQNSFRRKKVNTSPGLCVH